MKEARNSFLPLFLTNFFGVVNDNFLKTLAGFVVIGWMKDRPEMQSVFMGLTAGVLVLPYILFSQLRRGGGRAGDSGPGSGHDSGSVCRVRDSR